MVRCSGFTLLPLSITNFPSTTEFAALMDRAHIRRELSTTPPSVPPKSPTDTIIGFGRHPKSSRDRLSYDEFGPRELKILLHTTTTQLEAEALRASEAERELQNLTIHLKRMNDARLAAQQEALKAKEELKYVVYNFSRAIATRLLPQTIQCSVKRGPRRDISCPRRFASC